MMPTSLLMGERRGRKLLVLFMILPLPAAQQLKWMEQEMNVGRMKVMEKCRSENMGAVKVISFKTHLTVFL